MGERTPVRRCLSNRVIDAENSGFPIAPILMCVGRLTMASTEAIYHREEEVVETIEITAGKWTILVVRRLADGKQRFNALRRQLSGISQKTLTTTLQGSGARRVRRTHVLSDHSAARRVRADRPGARAPRNDQRLGRLHPQASRLHRVGPPAVRRNERPVGLRIGSLGISRRRRNTVGGAEGR